MKKKIVSALLCTAMVVTMVAGCGSKSDKKADSSKEDVKEESLVEGEFTKADGEIVYWSMWDAGSNQANQIEEIVADYEEASGNKVKVEFKGRDINTVIGASLDAGEKIDLYEDDFQRLSTLHKDYALSLDDMAEAAGYSEKSRSALTSSVINWAGSLVCLPYQPYTSGVFYNKAMFEEVGVEEPQTWEEFLDVCQKLKDADITPLVVDDAYITMNLGFHLARYIGQDAVKDVVNNGNWAENEAVLKMAKDIAALKEKGYLSEYTPAAFPEGENELGYEETAMLLNASWVPDEITTATGCDLEWGMFSYPSVEGGVDGTEATMIGGQGISVSKDSKNAQAAFELAMCIVTGKGDAALSKASNAIPADPTNEEWPEIIKNCKEAFDNTEKGYEWACGMEDNADMKPIISEWGGKLLSGDCTPEEFVAGLEAASK